MDLVETKVFSKNHVLDLDKTDKIKERKKIATESQDSLIKKITIKVKSRRRKISKPIRRRNKN